MPGVPRQLQPLAVHVLPPVDIPGLPRLYSSEEARKCTRCGINKWTQVRRELDHVMIEGRWFCTAEALRAYIKKKTIKGVTPDGAARVTPLRQRACARTNGCDDQGARPAQKKAATAAQAVAPKSPSMKITDDGDRWTAVENPEPLHMSSMALNDGCVRAKSHRYLVMRRSKPASPKPHFSTKFVATAARIAPSVDRSEREAHRKDALGGGRRAKLAAAARARPTRCMGST